MSWNEFLTSDDFKKYRRKQIQVICELVDKKLWGKEENDIKGILELSRELLRLPESLCTGARDQLKRDLVEDYKTLAVELTRAHLNIP